MENSDQEIIDSTDRWKQQEHEREMRKINLRHERQTLFISTIRDFFRSDNFIWISVILGIVAIVGSLTFSCTKPQKDPLVEIDCSKADVEKIKELFEHCRGEETALANRKNCISNIENSMCEKRVIKDYSVEMRAMDAIKE